MTEPFKVGDEVICIRDEDRVLYLQKNKRYIVNKVFSGGYALSLVDTIGVHMSSRFEHAVRDLKILDIPEYKDLFE